MTDTRNLHNVGRILELEREVERLKVFIYEGPHEGAKHAVTALSQVGAIEAERDRLRIELDKANAIGADAKFEIDRLVSANRIARESAIQTVDEYETRIEQLRAALRRLVELDQILNSEGLYPDDYDEAYDKQVEALKEAAALLEGKCRTGNGEGR